MSLDGNYKNTRFRSKEWQAVVDSEIASRPKAADNATRLAEAIAEDIRRNQQRAATPAPRVQRALNKSLPG
jgi:hypothetical protein